MKKELDMVQGKERKLPEETNYPRNRALPVPHGRLTRTWENICTLPRSSGGKRSLKETPYKSRLKQNRTPHL